MLDSKYKFLYCFFIPIVLVLMFTSCNQYRPSDSKSNDNVNYENSSDVVSHEVSDTGEVTNNENIQVEIQNSHPESPDEEQSFYKDTYYTNRTSAARMYQEGNIIYYSNVYDNKKLYKYNMDSNVVEALSDEIVGVQFISIANEKVYFSGYANGNHAISNIYSIDKNGDNLCCEIENAKGPIVIDGYIYYHDAEDEFVCGISRKNIETEKIENLVDQKYQCSDMTMNIVDNAIYFHNIQDIYKYDIETGEILNLTNGKHSSGINKVQYFDGYLYYYTYKEPSSINRMNISTYIEEEVCTYNDGNFWYDNLLIIGDILFFTGRQFNALKAGEPKENFVRGTFKYSITESSIQKIYNRSLGPTCYVTGDCLIAIMNEEDAGVNEIVVVDYNGNDISHYYSNFTLKVLE